MNAPAPFHRLQIFLCAFLCALSFGERPVRAQAPAAPPDHKEHKALPISGAARFDADHVIFVHDAKAVLHEGAARVTVAQVGHPGVLSRVDFPVPGDSPNDLEAICPIPGKPHQFLIAESGYYRPENSPVEKYGRVFWVEIQRAGEGQAKWSVKLLKTFTWPAGTIDIEGLACVATPSGYLLLAGRRDGLLRFFEFTEKDDNLKPSAIPDLPLFDLKSAVRFNRKIAELYFDADQNLWTVAANEIEEGGPGEGFGPFRSMILNLGPLIQADGTVGKINEHGASATIEGFKVEALTSGRRGGEFLFGTDDESMGGVWRYVEVK